MPSKYPHTIKLPAQTILMRGANTPADFADKKTTYLILLNNRPTKEVLAGMNYIKKYGSENGFEFFQTKRQVTLLNLPYTMMYEFDTNDSAYQKWVAGSYSELTETLSNMLKSGKIDLPTFSRYASSLHDFFCMSDVTSKVFTDHQFSKENIDYDVDKIVCAAGYAGWIRKTSDSSGVDEIMLCPRVRKTLISAVEVEDIVDSLDEEVKRKVLQVKRSHPLTQDPCAMQQRRRQVKSPGFSESFDFAKLIQRQHQKLRSARRRHQQKNE
jgi:hypothetical protein